MYHRIRGLRFVCLLLSAGAIVFALAACGSSSSSSGDANTLLRQTFGGTHTVISGN